MWKAKERFFSGSRSLRFDMPVYHKGAIHFILDCSPYLYKSCLWRRILKIRVRAMKVLEKDPYQIVVKSFMILNGKFLVFTTEEKIYLYCLTDNKIHKFWDYKSDFNFLCCIPYTDTLRTCDIGRGNLSLPIHV
ncbi:hypothetical protein V8G54_008811 [Vigna mungo]|uniref:F-box protein n=1 Tax=Vigna mungo TaxID=3915 RepID=A0AAQ3S6U6_VIGMU